MLIHSAALLAKEAEMDVVTPITTVPVINPTITPPTTTTTPVYNPFPTISSPVTPTPITNPFSTPAMMTPSGQNWCVASQTASQTALQVALDYACGYGGADCSAIQKGGSCFDPDTLRDHASYAFNDYYQRNPVPTSCDFGGTASIVNADPSEYFDMPLSVDQHEPIASRQHNLPFSRNLSFSLGIRRLWIICSSIYGRKRLRLDLEQRATLDIPGVSPGAARRFICQQLDARSLQ
ncbi:hypothetical protein ZIOFF_072278 [Zingiber officinale]|uniref:X8 domain-containing protein n=1 Tax=Zingiber officinale TaxID=94328 RepID=A0A8J5CAR3_ZINOF|nr:hypothetical protein ZIOFF_072278 [Zingiber officinale]